MSAIDDKSCGKASYWLLRAAAAFELVDLLRVIGAAALNSAVEIRSDELATKIKEAGR